MRFFPGLGSSDIDPSAGDGRPAKISHSLRSFWNDTNAGILLRITLILGIIIVAVLYWIVFSLPVEVSCDDSSKVSFQGVFRGICVNSSYPKFHDLLVSNVTIPVEHFDRDYLQGLIGRDVTIVCCKEHRHDKYRNDIPPDFYNVFNAFINTKT
jgi:hypothetical protein